jgi:hypothetical protein
MRGDNIMKKSILILVSLLALQPTLIGAQQAPETKAKTLWQRISENGKVICGALGFGVLSYALYAWNQKADIPKPQPSLSIQEQIENEIAKHKAIHKELEELKQQKRDKTEQQKLFLLQLSNTEHESLVKIHTLSNQLKPDQPRIKDAIERDIKFETEAIADLKATGRPTSGPKSAEMEWDLEMKRAQYRLKIAQEELANLAKA